MPLDRIIFSTPDVSVGAFRCATHHPEFQDSGPAQRHLVVFPRTGVWIRHAGSRAFPVDPRVVTIYNRGQEYTRAALHPEGDRSDWFGFSSPMAREMVRDLDPGSSDDSERPFRFQYTESDPALYCRQRILFERLRAGPCDPLEVEEEALAIAGAVIRRACRAVSRPLDSGRARAHRELAEHARAEITASATRSMGLDALARRVGVSPWQLCKVFRRETGTTVHAFRLDVRLRMALERLADQDPNLTRLALDLGFSSHSHFTAAVRQRMGHTPSELRRRLAGRGSSDDQACGSM